MSTLPPSVQDGQARDLLDALLPMLRAYTLHLVGGVTDAEDVAQDVCLEVLADPAILLRGDDPGAYLRGIARHLTSRHRRRFRRHQPLEDLIDLTWSQDEDVDEEANLLSRKLARCLEGMQQRIREMMDLRYRSGLNATEIGERLTCSAEAVRMALSRGRQLLGRCLERQERQVDPGALP